MVVDTKIIEERLLYANKYLEKIKTITDNYQACDLDNNFDLQLESERSFEVLLQIIF